MAEHTQNTLTPKLRFPEFHSSAKWNAKPLDDFCDRITEKVGDKKLTPVSISSGIGFVPQAEKFGRDISGAQYSNYIRIRRGDFAYNRGNSKRFPQGCVYQLTEFKEVAASNAFYCFRLNPAFMPAFFKGLFESNYHGRQLIKDITSSARSTGLLNIKADTFFGITIPMPPDLAEQEKVAECLASLDELITAIDRKISALRDHKKGLMQQLLPEPGQAQPELRFPQFSQCEPWDTKLLDDLAKRGTGHTPDKKKAEYYNGGIAWVSLADSKRLDQGLISETQSEISITGIENSSAVLHPSGTVILSRDAGVGKSAILGKQMAVSQHFIVWKCKEELLSNWFLYHLLQKAKPRFEDIATGSTIKTIGVPYFKLLRVAIPELKEQQAIADCLTYLDKQIAAQTSHVDALKLHKRGLMQQLFPIPEDHE